MVADGAAAAPIRRVSGTGAASHGSGMIAWKTARWASRAPLPRHAA